MELWVPFAKQYPRRQTTRGPYRKGSPEGLLVHASAGRDNPGATLEYSIQEGHSYMVIDRSGQLFQSVPLDQCGYHSGPSKWPGITDPLYKVLVGVEVLSAGKLVTQGDDQFTWWGDKLPPDDIRYVPREANRQAGYYQVYTQAQQETLANLCWWLKSNAPDIFSFDLVLGHDEVAPGRKTDPGGCLSWTMLGFRQFLNISYQGVKCETVKL